MKNLTLLILLLASALIVKAQAKIEYIKYKDQPYAVTQKFPAEIIGRYKYEKGVNGEEPIVVLNQDGTGLFQPHGIAPIAIKFWIVCDEAGKPAVIKGTEQRYGYTLVVQYKNSTNGNYPNDGYDLMGCNILKDDGYAVIYGERYKAL